MEDMKMRRQQLDDLQPKQKVVQVVGYNTGQWDKI